MYTTKLRHRYPKLGQLQRWTIIKTARYNRSITINHRGTGSSRTTTAAAGSATKPEPRDETSVKDPEWIHQYTPIPNQQQHHHQLQHYTNSNNNSSSSSSSSSNIAIPLHNSLDTFLHYASRTNLSPSSTVYRGTKYEYTCLQSLGRLGFTLERTGGSHDAGIDLNGCWYVPGLESPLKTIVQCKLLKKGISPVLVRELEGAFMGRSLMDRGSRMMGFGVLCTPGLATKAVREAVRRSERPLVLATIDENGWIDAVTWNAGVQDVLSNVSVGLRYVDGRKQAVLLVDGQPFQYTSGENREESDVGS